MLLVLAGGYWWHGKAQAGPTSRATPPPRVSVVQSVRREFPTTVAITGLISARNDLPIGNEGDAGRIVQILVEAGQRVRAGQVLARLDQGIAISRVNSAQAALAEARASAALARAEWLRAKQGPDLFSREDADQRRAAAASALAKEQAAEAQLADARSRLAHTVIRAPAAGLVLTRTAEIGEIAVPGQTVLFHLARDGRIELRGQVAEVDMPRLAVGQVAAIRLEGVDRTYRGTVWQVGSVIDPATRQGSVRIAMQSGDRDLRPGAFARAEVQVGSMPGVLLPQTAVLSDEHGSYVLVVDGADKVEQRRVNVAHARSDGLLIGRGLNGTERVVAIAGPFLQPGQRVVVAGAAS
ncbi:MAG: efflux RND transporter periplasmic adaptor subunit [Gammaproteobacteria bacterium]|nr:efflux RND transporter periplasmic adaptor subunit [Gammaproteobacteria bacterium]